MFSHRRGGNEIIVDILIVAKKGIKKTNIMHRARLSFTQLKRYLKILEKEELISEEFGVWKTTGKGLKVVDAYESCGLRNLVKCVSY